MSRQPGPLPSIQAGFVTESGVEANGGLYTDVPVAGGSSLPVGTSALLLGVGRGRLALTVGGYLAPGANESGA